MRAAAVRTVLRGRQRALEMHRARLHRFLDVGHLEDVGRNVDQHRPGPAAARERERLAHGRVDLRRIGDQEARLRRALRDRADVRFLEAVRSHQAPSALAP